MANEERNIHIRDFRLVKLTLVDVGPFREYYEIDFTGAPLSTGAEKGSETACEPANFFLLLSKNGFGKTTALEVITLLFDLLGKSEASRFGHYDLDDGTGKIQADFRANWSIDDSRSPVLLSIWAGSEGPVYVWTKSDIESVANASEWAKVGFVRSRSSDRIELGPGTNELGKILATAIRHAVGTPPPALFGEGFDLPTVLFFPADRAVRRPPLAGRAVSRPEHWGYRPSFRFEVDGTEWANSLDNLLVWLSWLADDRDRVLREYVEKTVFMDGRKGLLEVDRERLSANVKTPDGVHPLYNLSHGERQVLQLLVRTPVHMTNSTILLIDEVEMHLHPKWRVTLLETLKVLVKDFEGLSVIVTTHERELIQVFQHEVPEEGLVKGGFLIEQDL